MKFNVGIVALLALQLCVVLASIEQDAQRHTLYVRNSIPLGWNRVREARDTEIVEFWIALKQRNVERLEKVVYEVSHPRSPLYGKHWTYQQVLDLVAPPKEDHDLVVNWLISGGIKESNIVSRRDSLQVRAPVEVVERLFETEMHAFVHSQSGRKRLAHMGAVSIPEEIKEYVDMVSALSLFPPHRSSKAKKAFNGLEEVKRQANTPWVIPNHLRDIYNVPTGLRATNPKTTQAAVEFEWPGCFSYADITQYQQLLGVPFTNVTRIIPPDEWSDQGCDAESTMDLELMLTVGSGAQTWYFTNENWIYEFTQTLMSVSNPPLVTSLSWGWMEAQQCDSITNSVCGQLDVDSQGYVARTNTELAKAATMGLSVIVCTQDEGAPSDNNDDCSLDNTNQPVWPIYPSSSPWVTAVGATTVIAGSTEPRDDKDTPVTFSSNGDVCAQISCNNGTQEKVAMSADMDTLFTSGGGFSNYTASPSYQAGAVKAYFASNGIRPPQAKFNSTGRGYPDISASGGMTLILMDGQPQWNGGTSASTPVFSGIVSLLNDYRLNAGKAPLGFLNYILYDMGENWPQAFHPITQGNNTCTGWQMDTCCKYGFSAINGWNPAVGFGTPNFTQMLNYIKKLP